jgi:hypothetical protein
MLLILLCFVLSYYVSLRSEFCFVMSYYVSLRSKFCFVLSYYVSLRSEFCFVMSYYVSLRSEFCFVLSYYVSLRSEFCFVMSYYVSLRSEFCFVMFLNTIFGSFLPPVVCGMFYVLFTRFVFASALWCPTPIVLCFVLFFLVLCTSFSGLSSFDCPFGIL